MPAEVALTLVIAFLLVERAVTERRHHRERLDLSRAVVARSPAAALSRSIDEPATHDNGRREVAGVDEPPIGLRGE